MSASILQKLRKVLLIGVTIALAIQFISAEPFAAHSIPSINKNKLLGPYITLNINGINSGMNEITQFRGAPLVKNNGYTAPKFVKNLFAHLKNSVSEYNVSGMLLGELKTHRQSPLDTLTHAEYDYHSINQVKGVMVNLKYMI